MEFVGLGRWWGTDATTHRQTEIDIMGEQDKNTALFAECKWTNEKVDVGVLETLAKRSQLFRYKRTELVLFAKRGFTRKTIQLSHIDEHEEVRSEEEYFSLMQRGIPRSR